MVGTVNRSSRSYIDPLFRTGQNKDKVLSIQVGMDGIQMALVDEGQNRIVVVQEQLFDIPQNHFQLKDEIQKALNATDFLKIYPNSFNDFVCRKNNI